MRRAALACLGAFVMVGGTVQAPAAARTVAPHMKAAVTTNGGGDRLDVIARVTTARGGRRCDGTARMLGRAARLPRLRTGAKGGRQWHWYLGDGAKRAPLTVRVKCRFPNGKVHRRTIKRLVGPGPSPRRRFREVVKRGSMHVERWVPPKKHDGSGGSEDLYPRGQCTWYVATQRPDLPYFPGAAGDAKNWVASARAQRLPTGARPVVGAVAVFQPGQYGAGYYGHVAYVVGVKGDTITVAEANFRGRPIGSRRTTLWEGLSFIYRSALPPLPQPSAPSSLPPLPPVPEDGSFLVQPAWLTPSVFLSGRLPGDVHTTTGRPIRFALDAEGNQTALWAVGGTAIASAVRPATTRTWGDIQYVVPNGAPDCPDMAMDDNGNAVAVWARSRLSNGAIESSVRRGATGAWEPPQAISASGQPVGCPRVAMDLAGNATAVWSRSNGTNTLIQSATRLAGADRWQPVQDLSDATTDSAGPEIAIDGGGATTVVWTSAGGVQSASRPSTAAPWQLPVALSLPGATTPRLAVASQGLAVAVWVRPSGSGTIVEAATRPPGGPWQSRALSDAGRIANDPKVAVDPQGDVTVVWSLDADTAAPPNRLIQTSTRLVTNGVWQTPHDLTAARHSAGQAQVAMSSAGATIAIWTTYQGVTPGHTTVQSAIRPTPSSSWQSPQDLREVDTPFADADGIRFDQHGNAFALWRQGVDTQIGTTVYDAAAPQLSAPSIPASGTVGVNASFDVTAVDPGAGVASISWSFGDGTTASGSGVSHVYEAPGVYVVTVIVTDALGNWTRRSRLVTIAAG